MAEISLDWAAKRVLLSQARNNFILPALVWDVFEGITPAAATNVSVISSVSAAPTTNVSAAPSVTVAPATSASTASTPSANVDQMANPYNKEWYAYLKKNKGYRIYATTFDPQMDYQKVYEDLDLIFRNLPKLRLQYFNVVTLATNIVENPRSIYGLVYPVDLRLYYNITPVSETAHIDADIMIRQLEELVLIGVVYRKPYIPNVVGKAWKLEDSQVTPNDPGSIDELQQALPGGHYYTITTNGLKPFLSYALKVGYLLRETYEFVVDGNNEDVVRRLAVEVIESQ